MAKKRKLRQPKPSQEQETHQWDRLLKTLMKANPQDLVSWILTGATYEGELSLELLQKAPVFADLLYIVKWREEKFVLHVEFQRENDTNMDRRLWEYNCSASMHTGLPVYSVAIYLLKSESIVEPSYEITVPIGLTVHRFIFQNIKLWEIPREVIKQQKLPGLLPLLPLTKDGKSQAAVEEVIEGLEEAGRTDLLPLACLFATYTFDTEQEQQWLIERFNAMKQSLNLEDNYIYREWVKWAEEKGLKRGVEQGLEIGMEIGLKKGEEKGLEQAKKDIVVRFVELQFPELAPLARQQVALVTTSQQLQNLLDQLFMAHTNHEVQKILLAI